MVSMRAEKILLESLWAGEAAVPGSFLRHLSSCSQMLQALSFAGGAEHPV